LKIFTCLDDSNNDSSSFCIFIASSSFRLFFSSSWTTINSEICFILKKEIRKDYFFEKKKIVGKKKEGRVLVVGIENFGLFVLQAFNFFWLIISSFWGKKKTQRNLLVHKSQREYSLTEKKCNWRDFNDRFF